VNTDPFLDDARALTEPHRPLSERGRAWRRLSREGYESLLRDLVTRGRGEDLADLLDRVRTAGDQHWVAHEYRGPGRQAWARWRGALCLALSLLADRPGEFLEEGCRLLGGRVGRPVALGPEAWVPALLEAGWRLGVARDLLESLGHEAPRRPAARSRLRVLGTSGRGAFRAWLEVVALPEGSGQVYGAPDVLLVPRDEAFEEALANAVRASGLVLDGRDLRWSLRGVGLDLLEGPSVGLPAALALSRLDGGPPWPEGMAATGAITPDGRLGSVGSLSDKLQLAARHGFAPVCHPAGQREQAADEGLDGPSRLCADTLPELIDLLHLHQEKPWMLPARPSPFCGRALELRQVQERLRPGVVLGLVGPGGIGKTTLASRALHGLFADGTLQRRFPGGLVTCDFYRNPRVGDAVQHVLEALGEPPGPTPIDALRRALSREPALLFLDGAEGADDLEALLSVRGRAGVLLTTRQEEQVDGVPLRLGPFRRASSLRLLRRRLGGVRLGRAGAERLCDLVGDLPLAVHLVARYLATGAEAPEDFLRRLESDPLPALDRGGHRRDSVPVVLARSLSGADPLVHRVLALLGLLDFAPVPPGWISAALGPGPARQGWRELRRRGLVLRRRGGYQAGHRLIHQHARTREAADPAAIRRLVAALARWGQRGAADVDRCTPHVQALLANLAERGQWGGLRRLAEAFDEPFERRGSWGAWRDVHSGLERLARHRGLEDQRLVALGNTALALERLGQGRQAAATYRSLLEEAERKGDRSLEVAAGRHLGLLQARQGQPEEGLELLHRSLRTSLDLGETSQQLWSRRALALTLHDHGRPAEALEHLQVALDLSPEANERSASLNELGWTLVALDRLEEAEEVAGQALDLARKSERRAGEAPALSLQAALHLRRGAPRCALPLLERCLELAEAMGDRQGQADALGNLAEAWLAAGEPAKACELTRKSVVLHRRLGHPAGEAHDLATLGRALLSSGRWPEAWACCRKALDRLEPLGESRATTARQRLGEVQAWILEQQGEEALEEATRWPADRLAALVRAAI